MNWARALGHDEKFWMREDVRDVSRGFVLPILRFAPVFARESPLRTHLRRLSTRNHDRLCREELGQSAQIDGEHGQREHVASYCQMLCTAI